MAPTVHGPDAQAFNFRKGFTGSAVQRVGLTALGYGSFPNLTFYPYRATLLPIPVPLNDWLMRG